LTTLNINHALQLKYIAHAYELERLQRYDLALQEVQRALDLDPHSAEAHSCGAWVLRQSGRLDDAEEAARSALSFDPRLAAAYNVLACTLWSKGKLLEAEQAFEDSIALHDPETPLYTTNYARMMLAWQRPRDALVLANRALMLAPSRSIAHEVRGDTLRVLGEYDEAIEALHTALRLDPRNARAHNSLGMAQLAQGNVAEAQDSFREALRLQPGERKVQDNLISSLQAQYPLYARLLFFTMRANTTRGRAYLLWSGIIVLIPVLLLTIAFGLVYGVDTPLPHDANNLSNLLILSVFTIWLVAITARLIVQPFFNLLLRLDPRNRAVVQSEPADVVGVGLLLVAVLTLLTFGVLLIASPTNASPLLALYLCVASLIAVLLSGGVRGLDRTTTLRRWISWGSYGTLVGSMYVLAVASALLNNVPSVGWIFLLFILSLGVYLRVWVMRELQARQAPARLGRTLWQSLLSIAGYASIGLITGLGLGLELLPALVVAASASLAGLVAGTNRALSKTSLSIRWVKAYGEESAQNRMVLLIMSVGVLLGALTVAFRYIYIWVG
jgi:Flp pilus assembly protein TadD